MNKPNIDIYVDDYDFPDLEIPELEVQHNAKNDSCSKSLILKHNDLTKYADYSQSKTNSLSLQQQRIISILLSKIKPDDTYFKNIDLEIGYLIDVLGYSRNSHNVHSIIKNTCMDLLNKQFCIIKNDIVKQINILSSVEQIKNTGIISFRLSPELRSYLLCLKGNYTMYDLGDVLFFQSKYTLPIFEYLKAYKYNKKYVDIDVDDLKTKLNCKDYNFSNFKKLVDNSVEDINNATELKISTEYIKFGRKVKTIRFHYI